MSEWDGKERRAAGVSMMNQDDRDRFIRMETILEGLKNTMPTHIEEDKKSFAWIFKILYIGLGGLYVFNLIGIPILITYVKGLIVK